MVDNSEMIFGVRAVIEALQAGKEIDKIWVKKDIQSDLSKELFAVLKLSLIHISSDTELLLPSIQLLPSFHACSTIHLYRRCV